MQRVSFSVLFPQPWDTWSKGDNTFYLIRDTSLFFYDRKHLLFHEWRHVSLRMTCFVMREDMFFLYVWRHVSYDLYFMREDTYVMGERNALYLCFGYYMILFLGLTRFLLEKTCFILWGNACFLWKNMSTEVNISLWI
jgi:hypothetical protein